MDKLTDSLGEGLFEVWNPVNRVMLTFDTEMAAEPQHAAFKSYKNNNRSKDDKEREKNIPNIVEEFRQVSKPKESAIQPL